MTRRWRRIGGLIVWRGEEAVLESCVPGEQVDVVLNPGSPAADTGKPPTIHAYVPNWDLISVRLCQGVFVNEDEFRSYVLATKDTLSQLNESLRQINDAIHKSAAMQINALTVSACAQDMSHLAIRALAETNVEFRTILLRLAQEPATNPAAQPSRDALVVALSEHQRIAGERPALRPVPPSGAGA